MSLGAWDYGARSNPRSTGNRDLAWVEVRPSGAVVCRTDGQRLVVDLKRSVGMGTVTNTAFGPSTMDAVREAWRGAGVPAELLPKARWSNGERLPDEFLRTVIWWTYGRAQGLSRDSVEYDGAVDQLRYGEARGGEISPDVRCVAVQRRSTSSGNTGSTGNTGEGDTGGENTTARTLGRVAVGVGVAGLVGLAVSWWLSRDDGAVPVHSYHREEREAASRVAASAPRARRESAPPMEPPAGLVAPSRPAPAPRTRRGFNTMRGML